MKIERVGEAISDKLKSTPGSKQHGLSRLFYGDYFARFELDPKEYRPWMNWLFLPQSMEGRGSAGDCLPEATLSQRGQERVLGVTFRKSSGDTSSYELRLPAGLVRVDGILPYNYHWLGSCSVEEQARLENATINVINSLKPL